MGEHPPTNYPPVNGFDLEVLVLVLILGPPLMATLKL